jgi:hypothetical protein
MGTKDGNGLEALDLMCAGCERDRSRRRRRPRAVERIKVFNGIRRDGVILIIRPVHYALRVRSEPKDNRAEHQADS